jgi:heme A synthase
MRQRWIERWRLLDMFLVLIASLAVGKLLGWRMVALALPALALTHHDSGGMIWLWVNLVIAIVLAREAPEGRLRTVANVYRVVAAVALLVMLVPFVANQARLAIYPQLDGVWYGRTEHISAPAVGAEAMLEAPNSGAHERGSGNG